MAALAPVLRSVLQDLQRGSGADLASVFLYDHGARRFYAPYAIGLPEEGLLASLADMRDQLEGYEQDLAAFKKALTVYQEEMSKFHPDLSKVDEIGFVDLAPGGGHGVSGAFNLSMIELFAKGVPR